MVAKNHCLMKLRDKGKYTVEINEKLLGSVQDEPAMREVILKDKKLDHLSKALKELNSDQELCVTLFYIERKSYQQIAEQTGFNLMQVKSHIQNGKRNLKILMEKSQENE